jgi:peroxiredoxin Q/BCP
MGKWILLALLAGALLLTIRFANAAKRRLPREGETAPAFELPDQHGRLRASTEFRGKWLVLYFFPRAETPG